MNFETVLHHLARFVFIGALVSFVFAFVELVANFFSFSLIDGYYSPGRIVELAAGLLVLVIAIRLREIRDELRANRQ